MNLLKFDESINFIKKELSLVKIGLKYNNEFSKQDEVKLSQCLEKTKELLVQDANYQTDVLKNWHLAHRIIQYGRLESKINKISQLYLNFSKNSVYLIKNDNFFDHISKEILPSLTGRVKDLTSFIGTWERLPFKMGKERRQFFKDAKMDLKIDGNATKIQKIESEYFHVLANSLDSQSLKKLNIKDYTGNHDIYSLLSWYQILSFFIEKGQDKEKIIGQTLLQMIKKAIQLAVKTCYIYKFPQMSKPEKETDKNQYFKELVEFNKQKEIQINLSLYKSEFFQKFILSSTGLIPTSVLINEIVWDVLEDIQQLEGTTGI